MKPCTEISLPWCFLFTIETQLWRHNGLHFYIMIVHSMSMYALFINWVWPCSEMWRKSWKLDTPGLDPIQIKLSRKGIQVCCTGILSYQSLVLWCWGITFLLSLFWAFPDQGCDVSGWHLNLSRRNHVLPDAVRSLRVLPPSQRESPPR